ncbi:hypothetical protein ES702_00189 [subsurface metagenome]
MDECCQCWLVGYGTGVCTVCDPCYIVVYGIVSYHVVLRCVALCCTVRHSDMWFSLELRAGCGLCKM